MITYQIITAAILIGFVAHRGYYTRKVKHASETVLQQPKPDRANRIAGVLAIPAFIGTIVYIFNPAWMAWAALPFPPWLRWFGVGLALAGFGLLQWSQVTLGRNWSDAPKLVEGQQMITDGPYQWVRNPIYAAFLLILGSLLFVTANWFIGGLWIAMTAIDVTARIHTEEALLIEQFGEPYLVYMQRTGRLLPRLFPGK